jgi:hypothetical protein
LVNEYRGKISPHYYSNIYSKEHEIAWLSFLLTKTKCFTEYSFAAMDTKGQCYRFVEIVTKPPDSKKLS